MSNKFFAEMVTRSEFDRADARLELSLSDSRGQSQTLSLSADVLAALSVILAEAPAGQPGATERLTKIPRRYAVGRGRHEPFVMLRFEDEPAYGLSPAQAADLGEALLEEAETLSDAKFLMRQ
jgi:hypothetical protein